MQLSGSKGKSSVLTRHGLASLCADVREALVKSGPEFPCAPSTQVEEDSYIDLTRSLTHVGTARSDFECFGMFMKPEKMNDIAKIGT